MSVLTRDLVCREAVELVTEYLEGSLSRRDRRAFERHLEACDGCETYVAQVKAVLEATGRVGPEDLAPETLDGLTRLFREHQGEQGDDA
jgi:anti-sigma factor RsiW